MPYSVKMEWLLETAAKRRKRVLERLYRSAAQPVLDMEHEIADKDMQNMYNDWRWDVNSWINTKPIDAVAGSQVLTEAHTSNSAAQPASPSDRPKPISPGDIETVSEDSEKEIMSDPRDRDYGKVVAAPSFIIPTQVTPLYDGLLERLAGTGGDEHTFETLAKSFIFNKLRFKSPFGSAAQPVDKMDDPYELGLRVEQ